MSSNVSTNEVTALLQYLAAAGWEPVSTGSAGGFWRLLDAQVAVPHPGEPLPRSMWVSLLSRIADATEGLSTDSLETQLAGGSTSSDVAWMRLAVSSEESVALDAGLALVVAVHRMVRAAATTAQRTRAQIGGSYSRIGDEIASRARMGHTVPGSYILPILLPVSDVVPLPPAPEGQSALEVSRSQKEPEERRVMRTFAESLRAVAENLASTKPVTPQVVHKLVPAGVSREQLLAISTVLGSAEVDGLSATFDWSPTYRAPAKVRERVNIPAEAADNVAIAADFMRSQRATSMESFSGPIVEIRHEPGDKRGWVTVQTMRRGRAAEVRATVEPDVIDAAHRWMQEAETVIVVGTISSAPGRPLSIRVPDSVYALSESMLQE